MINLKKLLINNKLYNKKYWNKDQIVYTIKQKRTIKLTKYF